MITLNTIFFNADFCWNRSLDVESCFGDAVELVRDLQRDLQSPTIAPPIHSIIPEYIRATKCTYRLSFPNAQLTIYPLDPASMSGP